jgi:vacuolar-type H+-ATPase subunit I/STV1
MSRWRFWAAQMVWGLAALITAAFAVDARFNTAAIGAGAVTLFLGFLLSGFLQKWGDTQAENTVNNNIFLRLIATGGLFLTYVGGVMFALDSIGGLGIIIAIVFMFPLIILSALIWAWERISGMTGKQLEAAQVQSEKRKRDRLDSVLRDLSDDDLVRLRRRLNDGSVDDESLYRQMLGDDGELVYEER